MNSFLWSLESLIIHSLCLWDIDDHALNGLPGCSTHQSKWKALVLTNFLSCEIYYILCNGSFEVFSNNSMLEMLMHV
jgi:hypothetical protein